LYDTFVTASPGANDVPWVRVENVIDPNVSGVNIVTWGITTRLEDGYYTTDGWMYPSGWVLVCSGNLVDPSGYFRLEFPWETRMYIHSGVLGYLDYHYYISGVFTPSGVIWGYGIGHHGYGEYGVGELVSE